ncbi:MAG: S1C family serine protease [Chloroflexota bacterium]|jgi:serine protease Do|nr:S1C family serine protease [Chloroflexota bacterium]MDH5243173.1 S1C family serine protease [Chloroflexota bacterium]
MTFVQELSKAVGTVAAASGTAVVGIGRNARGSGVVVADGQVLTNAHNLRGDEVTVTFADGRASRGSVTGVDVDGDLAVVAVDTTGARPIAWGDGASLTVGSAVFGVAAAVGGAPRVTFGLVSAVARAFRGPGGRRISGSVEHTAPLAPGSSGGALVDAAGKLVGLNTNRIGEGFYLAIPADLELKARIAALGRGESPSRVRLGVAIAPSHVAARLRRSVGLPERTGILVRGVEDGSLADRAGVEAGDLIVSAGGREIMDADDLHEALGTLSQPFELGLVRGADERTATVGASKDRTPGDA